MTPQRRRFLLHAVLVTICTLAIIVLFIGFVVRVQAETPLAALSAETRASHPPPDDARYFLMSHGTPTYLSESVFENRIRLVCVLALFLLSLGYILYVTLFMNLKSDTRNDPVRKRRSRKWQDTVERLKTEQGKG